MSSIWPGSRLDQPAPYAQQDHLVDRLTNDGPTIDAPQLSPLLRGTSLPEREKDREFVSSKGTLTVMRVVDLHDDAGLPLVFSLRIECACTDGADGCGAHGSCVSGVCTCDEGYGGGMCETIVDKCRFPVEVDCGAHGSCVDGSCVCESLSREVVVNMLTRVTESTAEPTEIVLTAFAIARTDTPDRPAQRSQSRVVTNG